MHPAHDGGVGHRQAAFGHHLHQVSQAQLEAKIPAHAQDDDLAVKVATLEQLGSVATILAHDARGAVSELSPPDRSCGAVEQVGDDDGLAPDIMTVNLSKLSLPHHRHRFETRQSSPRGMETAEAEPRPDKALDTPVVLLDDVVEVFALPQTGAAR